MTARAQTASTTFDFYISTTGSDSNPGTLAQPWAITSLVSTNPNNSKMAGKRIGLIAGTYTIPGTMGNGRYPTNNSYCVLSIPPGTASASTYVASSDTSGNYSARAATIVLAAGGQGSAGGNRWYNAVIGCDYLASGDAYVTIDGLVVNGNGMDSLAAGNEGAHLIFFQSGTTDNYTRAGTMAGVVVQNCEAFGINATDSGGNDAAVWFQGTSGAILQNCYIHDVNKSTQVDHAHGHEEYGCQNTQIVYNTFANCTGGGAESKTGCFGNVCAYNYFYKCANSNSGQASVTQGWDGAEAPTGATPTFAIHHNIFDSCGRTHRAEYYTNINEQGINWYNNTTYDPSGASVCLLNSLPGLIRYYNNLIVTTASSAGGGAGGFNGMINLAAGGASVLNYNGYYAANGNYSGMWGIAGTVYALLAAWQTAMGGDSAAVVGDPQFSGGTASIVPGKGSAQFQPASGSPLTGAGRVGGVSTGAAVNIGAWDGTVAQIGCNFAGSSTGTAPPVPMPPVLTVS